MLAELAGAAYDVDQAAPHERLSPGEAHLVDPEVLHGDPDQPDDLVVGEHLLARQPVQALGGHAVAAAQVAPVRQRDPQVRRDATEAVGEGAGDHGRKHTAGA